MCRPYATKKLFGQALAMERAGAKRVRLFDHICDWLIGLDISGRSNCAWTPPAKR